MFYLFSLCISISFTFCFAVLLCFECVFCPRKIFISFWQWKCGKCIFNSASDYLFLCSAFFAFALRCFFFFFFLVLCVFSFCFDILFLFVRKVRMIYLCAVWFDLNLNWGRERKKSRELERERERQQRREWVSRCRGQRGCRKGGSGVTEWRVMPPIELIRLRRERDTLSAAACPLCNDGKWP